MSGNHHHNNHHGGKTAFIFPGQGSQYVGMGRDLYTAFPSVQSLFHDADRILGLELSHLAFHGPGEKLMLTEYAQPAILLVSYALFTLLRTKNLVPMTRINHGWTISNGLGVIWRDGTVDQVLLDQNTLCFPDPTDVCITPDGKSILVTHALSRFIGDHQPSMSEVTVIDTERAVVSDRIVVPADCPEGECILVPELLPEEQLPLCL